MAQRLPQDVIALITLHLTLDTSEHRHETFADRRDDARSFARVCRAWRATGTAAVWREVEVLDHTSRPIIEHVKAHPELYKHVESVTIEQLYVLQLQDGAAAPSLIASCPRLSRLEIRGRHSPGHQFKALQDKVDLCKFEEVVLIWPSHYPSWMSAGAVDRAISPTLLFAFLRACTNLRRFIHDGDQAFINETVDAPRGRRIKLDTLALNLKNPMPTHESDRRSSTLRSRFLLQFDLAHLVSFEAYVNLRDGDILIALDRMVNLETLRLVDDHELDVAALDALGGRVGRLVKLRDVDVSDVPEVECPTSSPILEAVKRLLDALPASVERLTLSVPLPEPFAEALLEGRDGLEHFHARTYDPLEVRPEAHDVHWRKTVEPVYESADERDELDEENGAEGL
ncbi:hypothetical protein JCM9279_003144 [Rhodotorula babjevae]